MGCCRCEEVWEVEAPACDKVWSCGRMRAAVVHAKKNDCAGVAMYCGRQSDWCFAGFVCGCLALCSMLLGGLQHEYLQHPTAQQPSSMHPHHHLYQVIP